MVKIVSRKLLGSQPVYDIGVERDHNFILATGLVASNCFNKSHSTAYAYVTYQTAYLKANYPVEYMAALLTANSDDQDKVKKYIDSCTKLNIKVVPPDINRSEVEFTPLGENILFGLSAVRNVGQGAVECILSAREKGGEFKSLADLCDRVDMQTVNSRALESLINCGAFDRIESNRKKLAQHLDLVIKWAQHRAKDRQVGQLNIFDFLGEKTADENKFESAPEAPDTADYPSKEKLQMEKELLGFYVSEHPLKAVQASAGIQKLKPISLNQLEEQRKGATAIAVVMLTDIKPVTTKKGDRMAILQIEDIEGKAEAVVFPKTYESMDELLATLKEQNIPAILWGKVDRRDDQTQLIVEKIQQVEAEDLATEEKTPPVTDSPELKHQETTVPEDSDNKQENTVPIQTNEVVMVQLTPQQVKDETQLKQLATILKEYSGYKDKAKTPVFGMVATQHLSKCVRLGQQFWVQDKQGAVNALHNVGFIARIQQHLGV